MILVTGATGTIGRHAVRLLREGGHAVRAMTRDPSRVPAGVEAVRADFDDPASLRAAADGVDGVLLITAPPVPGAGHDAAMVAALERAGNAHVVKLSAIGTGAVVAGEVLGAAHLAGEELLRGSGLPWTILRPSVFASNSLSWAPAIRAGEPVPDLSATPGT